ncbi:MAG: LytTR family DNA-binding domain-containing protein [Pseudomonadales bacterium]
MNFSLFKRLNEPFPEQKSQVQMLRDFAGAALFITAFLYFFKPFGLNEVTQNLLLFCTGYGVVTFVAGISYEWFLKSLLKVKSDVENWTLLKWIISSLGLLLWIAMGNCLYSAFASSLVNSQTVISLSAVGIILSQTMLVGIIPTVFFGLLRQLRANKANQLAAEALVPGLHKSALQRDKVKGVGVGDAKHDTASHCELRFGAGTAAQLVVSLAAIRYVEAMQNYIAVYYVKEGIIVSEMIRQTLSATEAEIAKVCTANEVLRCHRSFLVNVSKIEKVSGNAQGLRLRLSDFDDTEIPVSRSYIPALRSLLS